MKTLTRIRLINWHLFDDCTIPCQGTTYFIGANGAGKSTILDAVQFALVGGQREVRFNQAAVAGSKRTVASYVRGELGTEGQRYLRGDATGVVALEFAGADGAFFVHGAVIDAYEDGRNPDVCYFIVHNARLDDAWFFKAPGQVLDSRAFKRHLEQFALPPEGRAQLFARLEDYRLHLLNRFGQLKDSYPAKIVKGLAFTPLTDIRSFVHNYLLDENLVDVRTLQDQLDTLHHFERLAADVRERIAALERIEALDQERSTQRRLRLTNGFIHRRAQGEAHSLELKNQRLDLDEKRNQLNRAELRRETLSEQLRFAQNAWLEARLALQSSQAAGRRRELEEKRAALQAEHERLICLQTEFDTRLEDERRSLERLLALLSVEGRPLPEALNALLPGRGEAPGAALFQGAQNSLDALGQEYAAQLALLDERARTLRQEAGEVERAILRLRTGDHETSYETAAPEAARLRRLLRAQLGLDGQSLPFLCTVLDVPDESWQDAVEGVLGRSRFTLLVPEEWYAAAAELYRQRRFKDNLHGVGLLDVQRLLQHARPAAPDSLAAEVYTDHAAARAYVDLLLGAVRKCDRLEDLHHERSAITRECFLRRNFTTTHLDPHFYRQWFVGQRSAPRQIQQRQERLEAIAAELQQLNRQDQELRLRLTLTRDRVRSWIDLEHILTETAHRNEVGAALQTVCSDLAALDVHSVTALEAEVSRCEALAGLAQRDFDQCNRQLGVLEEQVRNLDTHVLPELEQEIDRANRAAQDFLQAEALDAEALAEIEKEYRRRCERQPAEIIRQNAARYEGEYAAAEGRARDQLREAKQAYSLRYDFGYDAAEDAARYLGERQKLVASELPQYEERIAAQRSQAEQELVENFIHRLREQIEDARAQLAYLNNTLAALRFGGERFEFICQPEPGLRQVYDMIMDSQFVLGDSLLDAGFRQKHQQGWDLLFERLTARQDDALNQELRTLQDYRNYLQYDIRLHYPNGDRALLSKINTKKSGGETTTPFYVAMVASFAQAYRLNQPRPSDTIRLALFDEAFTKMDTARTAGVLQFMRDTGLQVILATPPDKAGALLPAVDCVRTVVKKDQHAFVVEIDKEKVLAGLEDVPVTAG